jgi:phospholipid-transporting ATPase
VPWYVCFFGAADGVVLRPKTAVKTDPKLMAMLKDGTGAKADAARDFFLTLVTCNTIVPIIVDDDEDNDDPAAAAAKLVEYQGESPDEQALVYAAAAYGYTLVERTSGHIIIDVFGTRQRYGRRTHHLQILCFRLLFFVFLAVKLHCLLLIGLHCFG